MWNGRYFYTSKVFQVAEDVGGMLPQVIQELGEFDRSLSDGCGLGWTRLNQKSQISKLKKSAEFEDFRSVIT